MEGQDRRQHDWQHFKAKLSHEEDVLRTEGIKTRDRADLYVYQYSGYQDMRKVKPLEGASATVQGLTPGKYRVEFWDCTTGEITATKEMVSDSGGLAIPLPTLQVDIALRIRPAAEAKK